MTGVTYRGVQTLAGISMLLGNRNGTTIAVVAYDEESPVVITYADGEAEAA